MGVMALYVSAWFFFGFGFVVSVVYLNVSPFHFALCYATFTVCKQIYWLLIHECFGSFTIVRYLVVVSSAVAVAVAVIVDKNRIRIQFRSTQ